MNPEHCKLPAASPKERSYFWNFAPAWRSNEWSLKIDSCVFYVLESGRKNFLLIAKQCHDAAWQFNNTEHLTTRFSVVYSHYYSFISIVLIFFIRQTCLSCIPIQFLTTAGKQYCPTVQWWQYAHHPCIEQCRSSCFRLIAARPPNGPSVIIRQFSAGFAHLLSLLRSS